VQNPDNLTLAKHAIAMFGSIAKSNPALVEVLKKMVQSAVL